MPRLHTMWVAIVRLHTMWAVFVMGKTVGKQRNMMREQDAGGLLGEGKLSVSVIREQSKEASCPRHLYSNIVEDIKGDEICGTRSSCPIPQQNQLSTEEEPSLLVVVLINKSHTSFSSLTPLEGRPRPVTPNSRSRNYCSYFPFAPQSPRSSTRPVKNHAVHPVNHAVRRPIR